MPCTLRKVNLPGNIFPVSQIGGTNSPHLMLPVFIEVYNPIAINLDRGRTFGPVIAGDGPGRLTVVTGQLVAESYPDIFSGGKRVSSFKNSTYFPFSLTSDPSITLKPWS